MNLLGFDASLGLVRIVGCPELFPPRSLVAMLSGPMITVTRVATWDALIVAPYTAIGGLDGTAFADPASCFAYVTAALAQRPPGDPIETPIAATDLGGQRLVWVKGDGSAAYASCDDPATALATLGLTLGAATAGAPIDVLTRGPVEEPSWAIPPGPAFLGLAGAVSASPPSSGVRLAVGTFVTPTRLVLALGAPVLLAS